MTYHILIIECSPQNTKKVFRVHTQSGELEAWGNSGGGENFDNKISGDSLGKVQNIFKTWKKND